MTELQDRLDREREEIAERVATFKATQERFAREREEYFAATMENARNGFSWKALYSRNAFSGGPAPQEDPAIPPGGVFLCGR